MNNEFDTKLEEALSHLLEGESLSAVAQRYPQHTEELSKYQTLLSLLGEVAHATPSKKGLRNALAQMGSVVAQKEPVQSPYFAYFMMYRNVLVLPALLLVLIGGGVLVYPSYQGGEPSTETLSTETSLDESLVVNDAGGTGPAGQVAMQKTSTPEARTIMTGSESQVDPELQSVFAYSDQSSKSRSSAEDAAAKEALNDSNAVAPFSNTYDNTF